MTRNFLMAHAKLIINALSTMFLYAARYKQIESKYHISHPGRTSMKGSSILDSIKRTEMLFDAYM